MPVTSSADANSAAPPGVRAQPRKSYPFRSQKQSASVTASVDAWVAGVSYWPADEPSFFM